MSWQAYVDNSMVGTKSLSRGAIVGLNGGIWAISPNLKISPVEATALVNSFKDASAARGSGLYLNGQKYFFLGGDDRTVRGKLGAGGCHCVKTKQAVLVGIYDEGIAPGAASNVMEKLADYLISTGYDSQFYIVMGHGKWWGTPQVHTSGFYEYGVSPFQQKLFKGFLAPGIFKWASRWSRAALFIGPPFLFFYSLKQWADSKFEFYNRKVYLHSDAAKEHH
ncbi:hypothetical protein SmJEL517_g03081 [Synchytrium microbalum]|uniref:Multifunctional fusion protein n=1 Tax=Synchytrium microbalum TaxID=1806994 RepID=A0A507C9Q3_9FUNG|nr:uncharacterized protein SmJEL517_g03081 [Synchytrium microbalum]TPX34235.1 hypothetical protein SmJEL517_g03081 [Synchytrium microbalum]